MHDEKTRKTNIQGLGEARQLLRRHEKWPTSRKTKQDKVVSESQEKKTPEEESGSLLSAGTERSNKARVRALVSED